MFSEHKILNKITSFFRIFQDFLKLHRKRVLTKPYSLILFQPFSVFCNFLEIALNWSRRQGSNLRPHGPKPRALPTALRLDFSQYLYTIPHFFYICKIFFKILLNIFKFQCIIIMLCNCSLAG